MHAATRERRFELLFEAITDYNIFMLDRVGKLTNWNPGAQRMNGYAAEEIVGRHYSIFFTPDDCALGLPQEALEIAARDGKYEAEGWQVRKDSGRFFAVSVISAIRDEHGSVVGFAEVTRDITARRRIEERLRLVVEWAPHAMVTINETGLIEMVNVQTERVFGYKREELLGKPMEILVPERFRGHHPSLRKSFYADPGTRPMGAGRDLYGLRKDGSEVPVEIGLNPIETDEGTMVLSTIIDISERKHREEQILAAFAEKEALLEKIRAAHRKLEGEMVERLKAERALHQAQKMEAMGQMTGGIAHDFNNLLTSILGNLEGLQGRLSDEKQELKLRSAIAAAERGERAIQSLLVFARREPPVSEVIYVADVLGQVESLVRQAIGSKSSLEFAISNDKWPVLTDATQLELAILNLAVNACDAMPDGGILRIAKSNIHLDGNPNGLVGDFVTISVSDTGTGMPPDVAARVFEPFFTTKKAGNGTGLGLSQVYGFATHCGGTVTVASAVAEGTTVTMYLPKVSVAPIEAKEVPQLKIDAAEPGLQHSVILVVDDENSIRQMAADALREKGYVVIEAGSGDEGMAIVQDHPEIDLIFTDVRMPGRRDGFALAEAARRIRSTIKILFATGYASDLARDVGDDRMLKKPYRPSQIARAVESALAV